MRGLTQEGLSADLRNSYGDWGDEIVYNGSAIPGFLESSSEYLDDGITKPSSGILILHSSVRIPVGASVLCNAKERKIKSREDDEGGYRYRLN